MADSIDMNNRDPHSMNSHVQVSFDDVIAEPEGAHAMDCVWRNAHSCFNGGLNCCYKTLTCLCGLPSGELFLQDFLFQINLQINLKHYYGAASSLVLHFPKYGA